MLTANEKRVLRIILTDLDNYYSINQMAKEAFVSPQGAFKILKKFEKEGVIKEKKISNIHSFYLDFNNKKTESILKLALIDELDGKIKHRDEDLNELKRVTKACIIFGSYIRKTNPNDIDLFFVLDKDDFKDYKKRLKEVIAPIKIHDIVQTEQDIRDNLEKKDKVLIDILRNGIVLWGEDIIIKGIKDVCERKA